MVSIKNSLYKIVRITSTTLATTLALVQISYAKPAVDDDASRWISEQPPAVIHNDSASDWVLWLVSGVVSIVIVLLIVVAIHHVKSNRKKNVKSSRRKK